MAVEVGVFAIARHVISVSNSVLANRNGSAEMRPSAWIGLSRGHAAR